MEVNSPKLLRLGSIRYSYKSVNVAFEYLMTTSQLDVSIVIRLGRCWSPIRMVIQGRLQ